MNIKVSTSILVIIVLLGVSANTMVYAQQIITPQQPTANIVKPTQTLNSNPNSNFNSNFQSASIDLNNPIGLGQYSESNFLINCPTGVVIYQRSLITNEIVPVCVTSDMTNQLFNIDFNVKDDDNDDNDDNDDDNRRHHSNDNKHRPDRDCLFNASLEKCNPDKDGNCPKDFNLNEDDNCFPDHHETGCPSGTHGVDDDETGQCYPNKKGCPSGTEINKKGNNCSTVRLTEEQNQELIDQQAQLHLEQVEATVPEGKITKMVEHPYSTTIYREGQVPLNVGNERTPSVDDETNDKMLQAIDDMEIGGKSTATTAGDQSQPVDTLATLDNTATAAETTTEQPTTTEPTEEHDADEDINESDTDTDTDTDGDSGDSSGDSSGNDEGDDGDNGEESEE